MSATTISATGAAKIGAILEAATVIPVLAVEDIEDAAPLAEALFAGGLRVIETTLRTAAGLESLARMKAAAPEAYVGVGSLKTPEDARRCVEAGADFLVTPGTSRTMLEALEALDVPALPGAATVTEMMTLYEAGFSAQKFFPAEAAGGRATLKAVHGPLPQVTFCPTGGITAETARDYLASPNVACVGGSWIAPKAAIAAKDWAAIERLAREAAALAA